MNKRIISLLLTVSVLLVLLLVALPTYADENNVFIVEADKQTAIRGETITYTLFLQNAKDITAFGLNIILPPGLEFANVSVPIDGPFTNLQFVEDNNYQVFWYSEKGDDFTDRSKVNILEFQCLVSDDAVIGSELKVSLENILEAAGSNLNYERISAQVIENNLLSVAAAPSGFEVSGTITSFNSDTDDITVQLFAEGSETAAYTATVKGNTAGYSIKGVSAGNYTMKVSKNNHVTRDYTVEVSGSAVVQDVKICPIGDANCNGSVNMADYAAVLKHVKKITYITDEYALKCADANNNGSVNMADYAAILKHVKKITALY